MLTFRFCHLVVMSFMYIALRAIYNYYNALLSVRLFSIHPQSFSYMFFCKYLSQAIEALNISREIIVGFDFRLINLLPVWRLFLYLDHVGSGLLIFWSDGNGECYYFKQVGIRNVNILARWESGMFIFWPDGNRD